MHQKTILITGGTSGIGFSCAAYLLKSEYQVIITGRNEANLATALQQLGPKASGYLCDTALLSDIDQLVASLADTKLNGLFINAGIFKAANFTETTEAIFDETMDINFKGAFFTIQKMLPLLKNPASVVLNTSIVVFKAFAQTSAYTASKAALEGIAKVLNIELATKGIRVNIISPGVTKSPIQKKSGMSEEAIQELLTHFSNHSPIGRIVMPDDIAPMVEFLLSDKSLVLRNEKIIIDGGTTL
ncbi:MAG: SDR family oxidoreductase [Saprospiraceae bacterium]